MVVSDLDGTLLRSDRTFDPRDLETLAALGRHGILRCIATGRNLYSARQVLPASMPIDYLIFSSGAGTLDWRRGQLVERHLMSAAEVERAFRALATRGLDLMVHEPVPDNHRFTWYAVDGGGEDFRRRIERYREFARPGDPSGFRPEEGTQLLSVVGPGPAGEGVYREVRAELSGLSVIRSTSPLDGRSTWIEVFAAAVSKGLAAARVAARHGVAPERTLAVGNDYNDEDLLSWAAFGAVVAGAPEPLRSRFRQVGSHDDAAFSRAVRDWGGLRDRPGESDPRKGA
jgi:hydroxymethylpyrimidine pyrophosphatase-like HAD family hydrolase